MDKPARRSLLRSCRLPVAVLAFSLAALAAAMLVTTLQTRAKIRAQIASRDGEVLQAVALMEYANDVADGLAGPISDPGAQLNIVLQTSQLKGVLGVRLFDTNGTFVESFPPDLRETALAPADVARLRTLRPASHYQPSVLLGTLFPGAHTNDPAVPLLEVNVPLYDARDRRLAGAAQFLIEGQSIRADYARVDRQLVLQSSITFLAAGTLLALALIWAFRRLRHAQHLIEKRTEDLVKANQELALAAKTSALGTVTAHLLHDLKNPLAGLQAFVAGREQSTPTNSEWQQALASTRRMQALIHQAVGVLREETSTVRYEITTTELAEIVASRVTPLAQSAGVDFRTAVEGSVLLPNRTANLAALILVNLAQNAVQASPRGRAVTLRLGAAAGACVAEVRDQGSGFPPQILPFVPCRSTKPGGTGIGLALCHQLAQHLGATLELRENTAEGCCFVLALPAAATLDQAADASVRAAT